MAFAQRLIVRAPRISWGALACALVVGGFACDGTTEVGHHLLLILGGVAVGLGYGSKGK
jgi:hypothetical protein